MTKIGAAILILILVVVIGALAFFIKNYGGALVSETPSPTLSPSPTPTPIVTPTPISDLIRVDVPQSNDYVISPLLVIGEARGNWFFEASFPVRLIDENGEEIASGVAEAQDEWMTEEFVPFEAELIFKSMPTTEKGTLILEKDNPSGLPENAAQLEIPVIFNP